MLKSNQVIKKLKREKLKLAGLGVKSVAVFGSVARDQATETSDIDILVDFDARKGLFGFLELKRYLEKLLNHHVDLVTRRALHPKLRHAILDEAIYAY